MLHKLVRGGAEYLPFARSRLRALKAAGLRYASQRFEIGRASISVRVVNGQDFIAISADSRVAIGVLYESYDNFATGGIYIVGLAIFALALAGLASLGVGGGELLALSAGVVALPLNKGPVKIYELFADGSRKYFASGTYQWALTGITAVNVHGYEGVTPITPSGADLPRLVGPLSCFLGQSEMLGAVALYATPAERAVDHKPTAIDYAQTLPGAASAIHWSSRALIAP